MKLINKILFLLLVLFVPVFTGFVLMVTDIGRELTLKTKDTLDDKSESVYNEISKSLEDIYYSNARFLEEDNIKRLSFISKEIDFYEYMRLVNSVRNQLSIMEDLSDYVSSASIYYRNNYIKVNAEGSKQGSYTQISKNKYNTLIMDIGRGPIYQYEENGKPVTSVVIKPLSGDYIIELILSKKVLTNVLDNYFSEQYYFSMGSLIITNMCEETLQYKDLFLKKNREEIHVRNKQYYICNKSGGFGNTNLVTLYDSKYQLQYIHRVDFIIACLVVLTFLMMSFFIRGIFVLIHKPLKVLNNGFQRLEMGDFSVRVENPTSSDFNYLYRGFNSMVIQTKKHIDIEIEQQSLINRAELKQLQAQINPHFFYNSFFMLKRMITSGLNDEAALLSNLMGEYFEYLTRNSQELVPLGKEYHYCKVYSEIQKMRFENRFSIEMDTLLEEDEKVLVPKLVLQPVIENSFKYGLKNIVNNGILRLKIVSNEKEVTLVVEDNGEELTEQTLCDLQKRLSQVMDSKMVEMTGLLNINRRIQLLTECRGGITVERSSLGGLCTRIKLMRDVTGFIAEEKEGENK